MRLSIILILLTKTIVGQEIRWFLDKPNTKADTVAIIKNKVKSIATFIMDADSTYAMQHPTTFYYTGDKIDSIRHNQFPMNRTLEKLSKDKIIETITMKPGKSDNSYTIYRRIHYLDKDGQIFKTENKKLEGLNLEGDSYKEILYKYKDGLLYEAIVFDEQGTSYKIKIKRLK